MEAGEAEVDLEALEVRFAGRAVPFELDAERRHRLLNGLDDIALTLQKAERHRGLRVLARASRPRHAEPLRVPQLMPNIALLPGDGIGPEVAAAAVEVLNAVADDLTFEEHPAGGAAIDLHGVAITDEAMAAVKASDAVLLGALGGPKWDTNEPGAVRPEQGLFRLRADLGLYANLRPIRPLPRALRRLAAQARADRGRRHADRARAHRRPLLRRARHRERPRVRHDGLHGRGDRADRPRRLPGRQVARDERRQGQRARHLAGCGARSSPASTPRSSRTSSSSTSSSTRPR